MHGFWSFAAEQVASPNCLSFTVARLRPDLAAVIAPSSWQRWIGAQRTPGTLCQQSKAAGALASLSANAGRTNRSGLIERINTFTLQKMLDAIVW